MLNERSFLRTCVGTAATLLMTTVAGAQSSSAAAGPSLEELDGWRVEAPESFFAVVTHKEGVASGLAHEHLIVAQTLEAQLELDLADPDATTARVDLSVADLLVDDPATNVEWQAELLRRELISEAFATLKEKERQKIRRSMLSRKQLDVENHPTICAELDGVVVEGDRATGTLHLEIRGQRVSRELTFAWPSPSADGSLRVDVTQSFEFTDFGIKPYSALLGAIRVADTFDVVIRVVARPGREVD